MSECKHGVSSVSSAGCYNCVLDENESLRSQVAAHPAALEAEAGKEGANG